MLVGEELTVAELAQITRMKQPRVSTQLAKLKEAGLVIDRRSGVAAFYRCPLDELPSATRALWATLEGIASDGVLAEDALRKTQVLSERARGANWADEVAGDMERHYSPGRSWEAMARAFLHWLELGDVLDIGSGDGAIAQWLAPRARSLTCVDLSERVVAAARARLAGLEHVQVLVGDMHALPLPDAGFDSVLLLQALPFSNHPEQVLYEALRMLRPGGRLLLTALDQHEHRAAVAPYGHRQLGFSQHQLRALAENAGAMDIVVDTGGIESRPPHFATWVLSARKS